MLVWLNGGFGVGKTTTAQLIAQQDERWRVFDPELVGAMLRAGLRGHSSGGDFQHLPSWRRLVPIVAAEIAAHTGQDLVAVQTVLRRTYWDELEDGARRRGFHVFHVVLDAAPEVLRRRIEAAGDHLARRWRLEHIEAYMTAREWVVPAADLVVNTTTTPADQAAAQILAAVAPATDPA